MNRLLILTGILLCSGHATLQAALVYDFRFDQSSYTATSGSTINVGIIFRETATNSENLRFFTDPTGLTGLGSIGVTYQSVLPATNVLSVAGIDSIDLNDLFVDGVFRTVNNATFVAEIGGQRNAGIKIGSNAASHEINLGTITFSVSGNAGDSVALGLTPNAIGDVFFNNSINPTTPVSFGTATFSVSATAVPEPSATGIAFLAVVAGVMAKRRVQRGMKLLAS